MNRPVIVALLGALLLAVPVLAVPPGNARPSPSRTFAEETAAWRARWADAVRNERVESAWLEDGRLLLRLAEPGGTWRYRVFDAATGELGPAFDHDRVARELARLTSRDVEPGRLPLRRFVADGADLLALLRPEAAAVAASPVVRITAASAVALVPDIPLPFRTPRSRAARSGSGPATSILVRNRTEDAVRLFWLDGSGVARPYETVAAGVTSLRTTFTGHVWSIRTGDRELVRVVGAREPTVVDLPPASSSEAVPVPAPSSPPPVDRVPAPADPGPHVELRDGDVVLVGDDGPRRLTTDGTPEHGFGGPVWWSPDRTRFVVMKTRRAPRRTVHLIESRPDDQVQPRLHAFDYAKPGDPIDVPRPWVFDAATGVGRPLDDALIGTPWSLTEPHWVDDARFRLLHNRRGHQLIRLVEFDVVAGTSRTVVEEASDTFVDYPNKIMHRRLRDGRILWMSQRTGWNHLYLLDGETGDVIRPLTSGDWLVRRVESVDEDAGTVLLRVVGLHAGQDPYHHHFVRVDLETGDRVVLTDADGTHEIERSPDGRFYLARHSRVDRPPTTELRRWADGERIAVLAEADASELLARGWPVPERFVAPGRDGETPIWGVIFRPTDFDPARRYPVVEHIYAGPHDHFVPKGWSTWHHHRELAERGFVVVQIDGMGTNWRHKAFHDVAHRNLGDSGFPDRIAWLRAAAADRPWMDLDRLGIFGGSAGGQSALRALLAHGDVYRAAVADCGCHDNRVDKIWWNELWMGWPVGPHYAEQSNVTQAHRLTGDLLLIVGELDRNVDPASTMQVVDALIEADRDFELLVIPGAGHGAAESDYGRRRRAAFFRRTLGGPMAGASPADESS